MKTKTYKDKNSSATAEKILAKVPSVIDLEMAKTILPDNPHIFSRLLGGKGSGLAEMISVGAPVPPAFTITTEVCREYHENENRLPRDLMEQVHICIEKLESKTNKKFGSPEKPLLVSVRSGAKISMPGMMDTILNIGLNDVSAEGLAQSTGSPVFAWDSYQRLLEMYGTVVSGIPRERFSNATLEIEISHKNAPKHEYLKRKCERFKDIIESESGQPFPVSPMLQLQGAIEAVFSSWNNPRAKLYRKLNSIDDKLGTAVTVQTMVFGNFCANSGTGVCFTRNPSDGTKEIYGEFLSCAQGEDIVSGQRTPEPISTLKKIHPDIYSSLVKAAHLLENHYKDMQDIEFTIENGQLFLLQTRSGKRTTQAATRIAVEMVAEKIISKEQALTSIKADSIASLLLPTFIPAEVNQTRKTGRLLTNGLNASPGAASGQVVFDPAEAETLGRNGISVILLRHETSPEDLHGMSMAAGIITSRGGLTSHAAVVARGMGKPCIAGCEKIFIDYTRQTARVGRTIIRKGDILSMDGTSGEIFLGPIACELPHFTDELRTLLGWADQVAQISVRANADTAEDAEKSVQFGAKGIGLCRTEHMFMKAERLKLMQDMILAKSSTQRRHILQRISSMQEGDFYRIFKAMSGFPVTIRLLDPPLHEFLPCTDQINDTLSRSRDSGDVASFHTATELLQRVNELKEANPMLGFRGCRLGLVYPEIYEMQMRAIIRAAVAAKKSGYDVQPEIMIPLVHLSKELEVLRINLANVARDTMAECDYEIDYLFGTMIEVPRACVKAGEIADHADFFSFGTNDLTQLTCGLSRDDAETGFLQAYQSAVPVGDEAMTLMDTNPFQTLDTGVAELMGIAVEKGRKKKANMKIGLCGEHGGDPATIKKAAKLSLDYVSCSPYRIPIARLATAQAKLALQ